MKEGDQVKYKGQDATIVSIFKGNDEGMGSIEIGYPQSKIIPITLSNLLLQETPMPKFESHVMLVWDVYTNKHKCFVLGRDKTGKCMCVVPKDVPDYEKGEYFTTVGWRYSEELPKQHFMTNLEVQGFLANTFGVQISLDNEDWQLSSRYNFSEPTSLYRWRTISPEGIVGEPQKFLKEISNAQS